MKSLLRLDRPLAVIDLETTGLAVELDRIVEIGILKVRPDGRRTRYDALVNPGMPIPPEATKVHGICDTDVEGQPGFHGIARKIVRILRGCDLAGYNILRFDLPMLQRELRRAHVGFSLKGRKVIDASRIFQLKEPRDLAAAYRRYCGREHTKAHSSVEDARVCWKVLQGQLAEYADLPRNMEELHDYCNPPDERFVDPERKFEWRHNQPAFAFGKHHGRLLKDVADHEPDYLEWMLGREDFSAGTKKIVRDALKGKFPRRKESASQN